MCQATGQDVTERCYKTKGCFYYVLVQGVARLYMKYIFKLKLFKHFQNDMKPTLMPFYLHTSSGMHVYV